MKQGFSRIPQTLVAALLVVAIGAPLVSCGGGSSSGGGLPDLSVTGVTPARGGSQGGTLLTITGSRFVPYHLDIYGSVVDDPLVTVNGKPATSVAVLNDSTLVCVAPTGLVGIPVDVAVTTPSGTANLPACFTYFTDPPANVSPDVRLNTDAAGADLSAYPQISNDGANVYAVWEDWRNGAADIYFNRSQDGGATWLAADVRLDTDPAGAEASYLPQIHCDGQNVYVAWVDYRDGGWDIYFNRSLDGGTTWLAGDVRLDTDPAGADISLLNQICCDGLKVYVVWADGRNSEVGDIYFNSSQDGGTTWLASDVRLDTDPAGFSESMDPQICCDGSNVYVVWEDNRAGDWDIYLNRSQDGGTSWLASDIRLDTDPLGAELSAYPQISCDGANVYVVWEDWRSGAGDIYFNRSLNGGTTWLASDIRLDTNPIEDKASILPQICSDGSNVYVTWQDHRTGTWDIYFNRSLDGGDSWLATDVRLDTDPAGADDSVDPQISCDGANVNVVWSDFRHNSWDIYLNRSQNGGANWLGTDLRLDTDPTGTGNSYLPQTTCDGSKVYVLWEDWRNGLPDIYINTSVP